jgi:4-carboxymuconolactone decarboxylase
MARLRPADVKNLETLTPEQRRVHDAIMSGPRGRVAGPFPTLLRVPEICDNIQRLGAFLRYGATVSGKVGEIIILVTARYWACHYEWFAHEPLARKEGASEATIAEIKAGKRPTDPDAALIHDVAHALYDKHALDEALYGKALARFGEEGVLELSAMIGYYAMLAQVFATFEIYPPEGKILG